MKKVLMIGILCLTSSVALNAQVTIGAELTPETGALLSLKQRQGSVEDISNADKGLLIPRVRLTSHNDLFPMFESKSGEYYLKGGKQYQKSHEDFIHVGLVVFNVDETGFSTGLHFWDGTEWRQLNESSPAPQASIASLVCSGEYMTPNTFTANKVFEGVMRIPYTGGNGGAYPGTQAVDIGHGLKMERLAGTLAIGSGEVTYRIFGTPDITSPTPVQFNLTLLDKTCNVTIGEDEELRNIKFVRKTISPLNASTVNTVVELGHLKVRFNYNSSNVSASYPQYATTQNTHVLFWWRKGGSGSAWNTAYGHNSAIAGSWYDFEIGRVAYTGYGGKDLNIRNRDFGEALITIQHNAMKELYRVTFSGYTEIAADGSVPKTDSAVTIFVELLD